MYVNHSFPLQFRNWSGHGMTYISAVHSFKCNYFCLLKVAGLHVIHFYHKNPKNNPLVQSKRTAASRTSHPHQICTGSSLSASNAPVREGVIHLHLFFRSALSLRTSFVAYYNTIHVLLVNNFKTVWYDGLGHNARA